MGYIGNTPQPYPAKFPPLPIGNSDWAEVKAGYWSADKTQLISGLLALGRDHYEIKANREEGDGRPDIAMKPLAGVPLPGVILELKSPKIPARASHKRIASVLETAAREARDQIDEKRYASEMEAAGLTVLKYGVGFSGKHVALAV